MTKILRSLSVIRELAEKGYRIFSVDDVRPITRSLGLKDSYLPQLLRRCVLEGSLHSLYRGVYCLNQSLTSGSPITEYEIANYIAKPSALAFWSAFVIHHLTDQVLCDVLILVPREDSTHSVQSVFTINKTRYRIIRVKREYFFGVEKKFLTDQPIVVTDLERTLIDALGRPELCGGFREVINAFQIAWHRVNVEKLIDYGTTYGISVLKRIGWICENLELSNDHLDALKALPCTSCYKLDVSGYAMGKISKRWNLRENI